jgi:hypothetical protein
LNCPFNVSEDDCALFFIEVDGIVAARIQQYGTRFYADGEVIPAGGASSLESAEVYRAMGAGSFVMYFCARNGNYLVNIYCNPTEMALPMYKLLKYYILEFPRIMQLRNTRPILQMKGLNGIALKCASAITNGLLHAYLYFTNKRAKRIASKFKVTRVDKVPEWVDNIVLSEGKKYMEVHDHVWFQWCLDNMFTVLPRNRQSFYTIEKDGEPVGFYMTKERYREEAAGLKNVVLGAIMEWGTKDPTILSEADIYRIATTTFPEDVDIIDTATADWNVVKEMRKDLFLQRKMAHIMMKDKKKQFKDAVDINLWRVRYGYGDTILM